MRGGIVGHESKNASQATKKQQENSSPKRSGLERDTNGPESFFEGTGTRIRDAKKEWEFLP